MSTTIFRIVFEASLPSRELRDAALRKHFGAITITEWVPPENPGELAEKLMQATIEASVRTGGCAIEIDSSDRLIVAALGLATRMGALGIFEVPVLLPFYTMGGSTYPVLDVVNGATAKMTVPRNAVFAGFCRIYDAVPVSKKWPE